MNDRHPIYIQLRDGIKGRKGTSISVNDLAVVLAEPAVKDNILNFKVLDINKNAHEHIVVSLLTVIEKISEFYPNENIIPIGNAEILLKILPEQSRKESKLFKITKVFMVCLVLFIGTGLAIMNFHADVNMADVHKVLYRLITGKESSRPLIIQIPYSLGIGLGMAIFFNHIIPKKFNNEPSPMEVEMFSYRKGVDEFLLSNEKNTEEKK